MALLDDLQIPYVPIQGLLYGPLEELVERIEKLAATWGVPYRVRRPPPPPRGIMPPAHPRCASGRRDKIEQPPAERCSGISQLVDD